MAWILDTNVLSELRRQRPEPKVSRFLAGCTLDELYISIVSLAEIRFGIETSSGPERQAELRSWLTNIVRPMFHRRVLEISEDVMLEWRVLVEKGRKIGHTFSQPDLIIAATALHHGLVVVTRDKSGFEKTGVSIVNPWQLP
jgi:predicted nucleic acid-binding protein